MMDSAAGCTFDIWAEREQSTVLDMGQKDRRS